MSTSDLPLALRPMTEDDLPMLHDWLNRPHIVEWWGGEAERPSLDEVMADYQPRVLAQESVTSYIAMLGPEPIGYAQTYVALGSGDGWWEDETDPGVRGIDLSLAHPAQLNIGLGTRLVRALVDQLFSDPAVTKIQTDPAPNNLRAIRCYEKAGFVAQGLITTPDGPALYMVCSPPPERHGPGPGRPRQASTALELRKAQPHDFPALQQMLELYQYELSDLWPQEADAEARYGYDLEPHRRGERFHAHVAMAGSQYLGFALVAPAAVTRSEGHWMEQFFILKRARRAGAGRALAEHVLRSHPGAWEVGQMPANLAAQAFWRRVIGQLTAGRYVELRVTEGWWQGWVQQFDVPAAG